ncbi:DUF1330 domain-containing protein [Actinomadura sp. LD22]|uniref:DUF1330 domain-containing protein n=1 Tax=Actinomadura physcomitrii TaxID=2650748 RepID=A0A6I4MN20_9ACTN|nr:DUF1330 domain-containing protein [Actinomadura physcomitrii]MWA07083.1 DUF1330 domain-containing protein [Actinomadura physcomitrii]
MPKAYVILTEAIKDEAGMEAYGRASAPSLAAGGARVLAADPRPETLEGAWHGDRTVVLEFPSAEAARAWYDSPAYAAAKPLRRAAADTNAVIVAGFARPGGNER